MADEPKYKDAREQGMSWGTIIPNADYTKGLEHSGVGFDVHKAVPHNIVVCDPKGNTMSSTLITAEQLENLKQANRTADGFKNANCLTYDDVTKSNPVPEVKQAAVPPPAVVAPPAAPQPVVAVTADPVSVSVAAATQSVIVAEALILPAVKAKRRGKPSESGVQEAVVKKERVQFSGPFGKLTVLYNQVFKYDIYLVLVQVQEDGLFYEAPTGQEIIEVTWNNSIFGCLSGPHIVMPGQKTALTILLVDGAYTRKAEPENGKGRQL